MDSRNKVTFLSGVGSVTGSNFLFESGPAKILVDCGLIQGEKFALEENQAAFNFDINSVSGLIITHAHLDHVGRIPKLVKEGYVGPIYSTPQTRELAELVLFDAVNIMQMEARSHSREPLYYEADVHKIFENWQTLPYHQAFNIGALRIIFKDAGHILGSAMVEILTTFSPQPVLFTGDLGNSPAPLLNDTESPGNAEFIILESVYGDRNHESKEDREDKLEKIIKQTISRGGTLVIPAFAIDRTQVILYELNSLVENNRIPSVPIFVDSPMAIRATEIYKANADLFNLHAQAQMAKGDNLLDFPRLQFTMSHQDSERIEKLPGAKIILAGSGMSVGGRILGHEGKYLKDPLSTILLVGYQAAGSLGRQLADGAKKVVIHREQIKVKAKVETLYGFSAHKDSDHLLEFIASAAKRPKKVFVVMGEPGASMHLAQRINDELGVKAVVPERGVVYELQ